MDPRSLVIVFGALFLAELGDKTQLAVLAFTAEGRPAWSVFLGASLALVASTALAVVVGQTLLRIVDPAWLRLGGAAIFLVVGALVAVEAVGDLRGA
jgi:Ca2+/H+ antiporter, TMEM165/GDT1 family